jgi:hypothetical protein
MWGYVVRAVDVVWIVKSRVQRGVRGTFHVVQHVPVKDHALHALKNNNPVKIRAKQGCGSGSGLDPDSTGSVDPDPDPGG